jgi:transcriptional regulator of heat shock response
MITLIKLALINKEQNSVKYDSQTHIDTKSMNVFIDFINTDFSTINLDTIQEKFECEVKFKCHKYDEQIHYAIVNYLSFLVTQVTDMYDKKEIINELNKFNSSDNKLLLHHINEFEMLDCI